MRFNQRFWNKPRYYVTELEGYATPVFQTSALPGLSCIVIDQLVNHQRVAEYRSEQFAGSGKTRADAFARVRQLAADRASELNARHRFDLEQLRLAAA